VFYTALPSENGEARTRQCVTARARGREGFWMAVLVNDIVRITAKMQLLGVSDVVNVFHFSVAVNTTANDTQFMDEVADALDALYFGLATLVHPLISYVSVEGQNISQDVLLPSRPWPVLVAGANVSEMLPEQVSACVFHRTLKPRVRAVKFLPPMGENVATDAVIAPPNVAIIQSFGDALTIGLVEPNVSLVYVAFNRVLSTSSVVTQAIVPSRFRTQRRRRLGVGS